MTSEVVPYVESGLQHLSHGPCRILSKPYLEPVVSCNLYSSTRLVSDGDQHALLHIAGLKAQA